MNWKEFLTARVEEMNRQGFNGSFRFKLVLEHNPITKNFKLSLVNEKGGAISFEITKSSFITEEDIETCYKKLTISLIHEGISNVQPTEKYDNTNDGAAKS